MTQNQYTRLSINEREFLYKGLAQGKKQKDIAKELSRHPSTISREIRRENLNKFTYQPSIAEKIANTESLKRMKKYKLVQNQNLAAIVEEKIRNKWSPEQISGALKKEFPHTPYLHVAHETIYRYIYSIGNKEYREFLTNHLRRSRKRRKPRKKGSKRRTTIKNLVSIHKRPVEVQSREIPGHWEGDLIIGKDHQSAIGTLVERTTRLTIIVSFRGNHSSKTVCQGFAAAFGVLPPHMKKSLTYDRGTEMAGHEWLTKHTGVPVFFADPYSPWQRGTNENANGLIRDYFPKKTDFKQVTDEMLLSTQTNLNHRPRKKLNFHTPYEIFQWLLENPGEKVNSFYTNIYYKLTA